MPQDNQLLALCPLDGRYQDKIQNLAAIFSEYGLIKKRAIVEIEWFCFLLEQLEFDKFPKLDSGLQTRLKARVYAFELEDAKAIKAIESTTNHDVKAVEYWLQGVFEEFGIGSHSPLLHFACTSEDINNLSYALMLKQALEEEFIPLQQEIQKQFALQVEQNKSVAMLARTHGQAASPTSLGKEFAIFASRHHKAFLPLVDFKLGGKINGAVGNFNAHLVCFPHVDWLSLTREFLHSLGLEQIVLTTQIEPHDQIAKITHSLIETNLVLLDCAKDLWGYISIDYFSQKKKPGEVGSSTMPHKINPIDFENAEGNLLLANALAGFFAQKLPISRWQRDLTDSTVLRNLGCLFGYSILGYASFLKGLQKLEVNYDKIAADLAAHPEVLTEAIQTMLRLQGQQDAYEQLKTFSRGSRLELQDIQEFIRGLDLPLHQKEQLLKLRPEIYIGNALELCELWLKDTQQSPFEEDAAEFDSANSPPLEGCPLGRGGCFSK